MCWFVVFFFFSSRRRHTRGLSDWSSDVCSSDLLGPAPAGEVLAAILSGSQFDFVAVERPDSPGIVQRVMLTRRGGTSAVATAAGRSEERRVGKEGRTRRATEH